MKPGSRLLACRWSTGALNRRAGSATGIGVSSVFAEAVSGIRSSVTAQHQVQGLGIILQEASLFVPV